MQSSRRRTTRSGGGNIWELWSGPGAGAQNVRILQALCHHHTITAPPLHHHCIVTAPPRHRHYHRTTNSPSLHHHWQFRNDDSDTDIITRHVADKNGTDPNMDITSRPVIPEELRYMKHQLEASSCMPELREHYHLTWVQVTTMPPGSELPSHTDKPAMGEMIVSFTTHDINVKMKPNSLTPAAGKAEFTVAAGNFYSLSNSARYYYEHAINPVGV